MVAPFADEMQRRIHMRPGVHAQRHAGYRGDVALRLILRPLDVESGVARPVDHPVSHRDRDIDPASGLRLAHTGYATKRAFEAMLT